MLSFPRTFIPGLMCHGSVLPINSSPSLRHQSLSGYEMSLSLLNGSLVIKSAVLDSRITSQQWRILPEIKSSIKLSSIHENRRRENFEAYRTSLANLFAITSLEHLGDAITSLEHLGVAITSLEHLANWF